MRKLDIVTELTVEGFAHGLRNVAFEQLMQLHLFLLGFSAACID